MVVGSPLVTEWLQVTFGLTCFPPPHPGKARELLLDAVLEEQEETFAQNLCKPLIASHWPELHLVFLPEPFAARLRCF